MNMMHYEEKCEMCNRIFDTRSLTQYYSRYCSSKCFGAAKSYNSRKQKELDAVVMFQKNGIRLIKEDYLFILQKWSKDKDLWLNCQQFTSLKVAEKSYEDMLNGNSN